MPSSVIRAFQYDPSERRLDVRFVSGRRYSYYDVPQEIFDQMSRSPSEGEFFNAHTGERIRDKVAASKAKGMWMGGNPPLGYDPPLDSSRALVVNESEGTAVRLLFHRYLELGNVYALQCWAETEGLRSKRWLSSRGRSMGG
jgi:hypothetical protein